MKKYRLVDNVLGWIVFLRAAFVYCSTVEPTASFWDCPEFITTGYKLEVGHPPGAPFFMLTANLFSQFTSDPGKVALMVNIMNADELVVTGGAHKTYPGGKVVLAETKKADTAAEQSLEK